MGKLSLKSIRIFKTFNLYFSFFALGMSVSVLGPCLMDLQNVVNTDTQHISFVFTVRSLGYLTGSILGGIVLDAIQFKQVGLSISSLIVTLVVLGIPWSRDLNSLIGLMVVHGIFSGVIDVGCNVVCLSLWGSDNAPFYQALHVFFGLGSLAAPLIAAPFLRVSYKPAPTDSTFSNLTSDVTNSSSPFAGTNLSDSAMDDQASVIYPYSIIGGFLLLATILFSAASVISPSDAKKTRSTNRKDIQGSWYYLAVVGFLIFLLTFASTGIDMTYPHMLTTHVVKGHLKLSSSMGSLMTSSFWAAFTATRVATVFIAIKVNNFTLIVCDLLIVSVGTLVLLFLNSYEWAGWLSSVILGLGIASFYPSAVAWVDSYIRVTNKMAAVFNAGGAAAELVLPTIVGNFIDTFPNALIYLVLVSWISTSLLVFFLYVILRKRKQYDTKKESEHCMVDDPTIIT